MYKTTQYPAVRGVAGFVTRRWLWVSVKLNSFPPVLITFVCSIKFNETLLIFLKIRDLLVFQHAAAAGAVVLA